MARPSAEDLLLAAEWLDCYEDAPGEGEDDNQARCAAVASWLRSQCDNRVRDSFVRLAMKETGCSRAHAVDHFNRKFKRS